MGPSASGSSEFIKLWYTHSRYRLQGNTTPHDFRALKGLLLSSNTNWIRVLGHTHCECNAVDDINPALP